MVEYYLAVDIGASSGRHILAHMEKGKIVLEEVHRFDNGFENVDGHLVWDTKELFKQIKLGMKKCHELGKIPKSMGIDTWAVDYVLLDEDGQMIGDAVAYRDKRTFGMDDIIYRIISENELYTRTGIQKQMFNTIYQLMAAKIQNKKELESASKLLMIPDYFNYLLTGEAVCEYTNATTTQLVDCNTGNWDFELIRKLDYPEEIFPKVKKPGTLLGELVPQIVEEVGFNCNVILPATHDTGSAVMAVPVNGEDVDILYISSGTWSLMGTELNKADNSSRSQQCNFTNEGGYNNTFRFLKNIMGLWMIQSVRREIAKDLSFGEICNMAAKESISSIVDCNDDRFLAPENMVEEIKNACRATGQEEPEGIGQIAAVIYNSLAKCYAIAKNELENLTGKTFNTVNIVGGGANADYLNMLTAKATGCRVLAGPVEATAIGNITAQLIAAGIFDDLNQARRCIYESFGIKEYN